jgi:hypothetical protein
VAIAAVLLLLVGCARPKGTLATVTTEPSATPGAAHAPLTIASPVFHSGEVGVTYAPVTLSATGGLPPYTWTSVGSLPAGLTLSSDGVVSGTPTQSGYFVFGVQVLDFGKNDTAGLPANIPIVSRLTASLVPGCATECTVELGCASVCGTFGQVGGGAAPLSYSLTKGPLPAGTTLNGLSLNGTFKGLPGRLQFTVKVTDGFGATALITPTYNLLPHISLAASANCTGGWTGGQRPGCQVQMPYAGGSGALSVKIVNNAANTQSCYSSGPPPLGYGLSAAGGYVTVTIPGNISSGYGAIWTLVVTDGNLCGPSTYCSSGPGTVNIKVLCS